MGNNTIDEDHLYNLVYRASKSDDPVMQAAEAEQVTVDFLQKKSRNDNFQPFDG